MKKRDYLSPQMKVRNLNAHQMLCASTGTLTGELKQDEEAYEF